MSATLSFGSRDGLFLGQKMAKQVRVIPQLSFYLDTALDDVEKIEKELRGEGDNPVL